MGRAVQELLERALILRLQLLQSRRPAHSLHSPAATHQLITGGICSKTDVLGGWSFHGLEQRSLSPSPHLLGFYRRIHYCGFPTLPSPTLADSVYYEEEGRQTALFWGGWQEDT